ncbi:hypothetical protein [Streptomyces albogriseolus]|uniref:hypothetical protein n=1 Tax=Streptomyces albogriseolus TaxID=1887 RepID=UPI00346050AA
MLATVRRTSSDVMHADAVAAIKSLDLAPSGVWVGEMVSSEPGRPDSVSRTEEPADRLGTYLLAALQTGFHEVEQTEPGVITLRWTRKSKRNDYRTRALTLVHTA